MTVPFSAGFISSSFWLSVENPALDFPVGDIVPAGYDIPVTRMVMLMRPWERPQSEGAVPGWTLGMPW